MPVNNACSEFDESVVNPNVGGNSRGLDRGPTYAARLDRARQPQAGAVENETTLATAELKAGSNNNKSEPADDTVWGVVNLNIGGNSGGLDRGPTNPNVGGKSGGLDR